MDPQADLENLLKTLFNEAELKSFVQTELAQRQLLDWVPLEKVSKNELVANVVSALARHGCINEHLFTRLTQVRSQQGERISAVWTVWQQAAPQDPAGRKQSSMRGSYWPARSTSAFAIWRSWLAIGILFVLGIGVLLGGVIWLQGYLLEREALQSDNIILGELVHRNKDFFVVVREGSAVKKRSAALSEELVLLPARLSGFRSLDVCHLAVLVQAQTPPERVAPGDRYVELKVLDMHFDGKVCPEKFEQFLSKRWGVTGDISSFPSTYLRRAEQYNREAENQDRRLSERSFRSALEAYRTAMQIYQSNQELRRQAPARIEQRIGELQQFIRTQRFLINRVTERPIHELVPIPGGQSTSWHPDSEQRRPLWLPLFWIDRFEVSNIQYEQYLPEHFRRPHVNEDRHPVVDVSWHDAERYCIKRGLRLPTEDEYEKAGSWSPHAKLATPYPWQPPTLGEEQLLHLRLVHAVQEDPNGESQYRVLNLIGNVAEWTIRKHEGDGEAIYVIKGGSFQSKDPAEFEIWRAKVSRDQPLPDVGFRCAATNRPAEDDWLMVFDPSSIP